MAASAKPMGSVPETKDVKASAPSSAAAETPPEPDRAPEAKADSESDLDEKDLEVLDDHKKVPYSRFKEVNEKAKAYEHKLKETESEWARKLEREIENAELRIKAKFEQERGSASSDPTDPYEAKDRELERHVTGVKDEVTGLKEKLAQLELKDELTRLQKEYPKADVEAVLGWRRARPHSDLGELMERSHNRTVEMAKSTVQEILEQKKQRAKAAIPTGANGIRLKESEKPKSLEEAKSMVKKLFGASRNR